MKRKRTYDTKKTKKTVKTTNKQRKAAFEEACIKHNNCCINEGRNKRIYRRAMKKTKKS